MTTIREQIAQNIKRFRLDNRMNVDEVGAAIGKSGKTVSAWEVGRGQPDADTMIQLCRLFSVDISDFYGIKSGEQPTKAETRLVDLYRSMNQDGQKTLLAIAETLSGIFDADGAEA